MKDKKITNVISVENPSLHYDIWSYISKLLTKVRQRNYKCDSCGNSYTTLQYLKLHIKTIHEKQSNYKCDSCGKTFTTSSWLRKHSKILHEGQRNSKCDSCGKTFTQSVTLNRHILTVHERQTNFFFVTNHILQKGVWRSTSTVLINSVSATMMICKNGLKKV